MATVDEEGEGSEDQVRDECEHDFFDQLEFSDDQLDDDDWESDSIHSGDGGPPDGPRLLSADSDSDSGSEPESDSGLDTGSPYLSNPKSESKAKLKMESYSGDEGELALDSDPNSDTTLS